MLRLIVLLLILANGIFFAWAHGYLLAIGFAPTLQREPQRWQTQVKPEAIRLLAPHEAKALVLLPSALPLAGLECLESDLLDERRLSLVRAAIAALPAGSYTLLEASAPPRWIVYMGKYPSAEALAKKRAELRNLGVSSERPKNPSLEPGIVLAAAATQAQADDALANLVARGVRTAKVLQELPERTGQILRLPAIDEALKAQLESVKAAVGAGALVACKPA